MAEQPEPFDWSNDPAIILRRREAVTVFTNDDGDIVVLQQRPYDDDTCIVIPKENGEYFASHVAALAQGKVNGGRQS